MVSLLDCPAELRQQILDHLIPSEVRDAGAAPRTAPLLPLLLACKKIRLDTLQLLKKWSPVYHFERPATILGARWRPDEPHMRNISLRLFADMDLHAARYITAFGASGVFDPDSWVRCATSLPRLAVESVVVDLTAAPAWMVARRPDWVRGTLLDARNRCLLDNCVVEVTAIVKKVSEVYGPGVPVHLGGVVTRKAKKAVDEMLDWARKEAGCVNIAFVGEWIAGPKELPTRLSLVLLCRCWGMKLEQPAVAQYDTPRWIQIRNEAREAGLTVPDVDLKAVGLVKWSKNSCTAYYVNAQVDEEGTRSELVRVLRFAVEARTVGIQGDVAIDFEPAIRERRFLIHCLAKDLGLTSVSVGGPEEKFEMC
ncbi:hypothetical protein J7T55_015028 [Diaporthe amygdali]|uniref:uncharacterized protein n=1 Tax=Phomopsis amygdali TaxID=1214568 RepID=UPI0022FF2D78|nr:uncharacterized protein J7T55_015028 [Diaporthe amygdali]KAJ0108594.1 hypothetical protein J7T55_015028 [Diaporthe amygdali]